MSDVPPHVNFPGKDIERFWMVHFYNDAACEIIKATSLELPPIISTVFRANLPAEVGVGVRDYYFDRWIRRSLPLC